MLKRRRRNYRLCQRNKQKKTILPLLKTSGTHYSIGYDVGATYAPLLTQRMRQCDKWTSLVHFAHNTNEGRKITETFEARVKAEFPSYVEELRGIAVGSGIPFSEIFLLMVVGGARLRLVDGPR